jgi:hypothetical protein
MRACECGCDGLSRTIEERVVKSPPLRRQEQCVQRRHPAIPLHAERKDVVGHKSLKQLERVNAAQLNHTAVGCQRRSVSPPFFSATAASFTFTTLTTTTTSHLTPLTSPPRRGQGGGARRRGRRCSNRCSDASNARRCAMDALRTASACVRLCRGDGGCGCVCSDATL